MDYSRYQCLCILNASLGFKENCFERDYTKTRCNFVYHLYIERLDKMQML